MYLHVHVLLLTSGIPIRIRKKRTIRPFTCRPLINRPASATLLNQIVNFLYRSVHGYPLEIQYIVFKIRHTHVDRLCSLAENSPDALIQNLGVYWIDPDWGSRGNAFQASCNFTLQKTCIKPINPVESNSSKEVCLH